MEGEGLDQDIYREIRDADPKNLTPGERVTVALAYEEAKEHGDDLVETSIETSFQPGRDRPGLVDHGVSFIASTAANSIYLLHREDTDPIADGAAQMSDYLAELEGSLPRYGNLTAISLASVAYATTLIALHLAGRKDTVEEQMEYIQESLEPRDLRELSAEEWERMGRLYREHDVDMYPGSRPYSDPQTEYRPGPPGLI